LFDAKRAARSRPLKVILLAAGGITERPIFRPVAKGGKGGDRLLAAESRRVTKADAASASMAQRRAPFVALPGTHGCHLPLRGIEDRHLLFMRLSRRRYRITFIC